MAVSSVSRLVAFPPAPAKTLTEAALAYAQLGIPIFPLRPRDKKPLVPHGFHDATTDLVCIRQWWEERPDANIGMPTGQASSLVVLDVDPRHDGHHSLRHLQRALAHHAADRHQPPINLLDTCLQRSGGNGLHLFFSWRAGLDLRITTRFAGYAGLDLRADGGYIVLAPSRHPQGGIYTWLRSASSRMLMSFPEELVQLLRARHQALSLPRFLPPARPKESGSIREARRSDPDFWLEFVLARTMIGNRHDQALFLACRLMQEAALSSAEATWWMREYARRVPQGTAAHETYPERDALACLAWASTHLA